MSNNVIETEQKLSGEELLISKLDYFSEELKSLEIKVKRNGELLNSGIYHEDEILSDFIFRKEYFEHLLNSRLADRNKDLSRSITPEEKADLVNKMLIDELNRLYNNINNYKYFIHFLKTKKSLADDQQLFLKNKEGKTDDQQLSSFICFKCNILMFLLDADYDDNKEKFEQFSFDGIELFYTENQIENGRTHEMEKDGFTLKGEEGDYVRIIRDAASHGEYYPYFITPLYTFDSPNKDELEQYCLISVENSKGIPRIWLDLRYEALYDFVTRNLSELIKKKYSFLLKILEADNFDIAVSDSNEDDFNQILIFMTNNIIQYNLEHHFNDTKNLFNLMDLPMFKVFDNLQGGKDVTSEIDNRKKLFHIKNAIGHNRAFCGNGKFIFHNLWHSDKDDRCTDARVECSTDGLLEFLLDKGIYSFSISEKNQNSVLNKYSGEQEIYDLYYTCKGYMDIDSKKTPKI